MNSSNKPLKRTLAREYAFKFIYKHLLPEFSKEKTLLLEDSKSFDESINLFDNSFFELDSEHPDNDIDLATKSYAKDIVKGALRHEDEYSRLVEKHLSSGNLQKVDRMNLAVLLLGIFEIRNDKETSASVFINEYVNIAKKYCPTDSHGFINSILDKISKENV